MAVSTARVQILVSNAVLQYKEPRLTGEMTDSRPGAEKDRMNLEYLVTPQSKEVLKHTQAQGHTKGSQEPTERTPRDQNGNNLNNKINDVILG